LTSIPNFLGVIHSFEVLQDQFHQVSYTETMSESVMVGTRIGEVTHSQLMNPPKPLHLGAIQQVD